MCHFSSILKTLSLAIFGLFQLCCSSPKQLLDSPVLTHKWRYATAYQTDEFRIYYWAGPTSQKDANCVAERLVEHLLAKGILRGSHFWYDHLYNFSDSLLSAYLNGTYSPNPSLFQRRTLYSTTFLDSVEADADTFDGRHVMVDRVWLQNKPRRDVRDTLLIGIYADLTGRFPGPLSGFTIYVVVEPGTDPCNGVFVKPRLLLVTSDGGII